MKIAFHGSISKTDTAKKRICKLEDESVENSTTEVKGKNKENINKNEQKDFPGGTVNKNSSANVVDTESAPAPG